MKKVRSSQAAIPGLNWVKHPCDYGQDYKIFTIKIYFGFLL